MTIRNIIQTDKAPQAIGPYSQGIVFKGGALLFTAGQIPVDPSSGEIVTNEIQEQTRQALLNLKAVLEAGGSELSHVIKTTVFLKNMNDFASMNSVYAEFFPENPPARSAVEVARLPKDVLIEIECVASIP